MYSLMANTGKTNWWRYLITIILIIIGFALGQMPLIAALNQRKVTLNMSDATFEAHFNASNLAAFEMDPNILLVLMMIPFILGFVALLLCIKHIHQRTILSLFTGRSGFAWKKSLLAFFVWIVIAIPALVILIPEGSLTYQFEWSKFLPLLILAIVLVPIQTTMEESFFRGYLYQMLVRIFNGKIIPFIIIAVGFALLHSANPEFSEGFNKVIWAYLLLSLLFGILPLLDDGLELPIGIHAANNLITVLFISAEGGAFSTPAIFHTDIKTLIGILPLLLPGLVGVTFILLLVKYRWNLKEAFSK